MGNKLNEKVSTGKTRGRPKSHTLYNLPTCKNPKVLYVPTGKGRGRPPAGDNPKPAYVPTGNPRGRKPGCGGWVKKNKQGAHLKKPKSE